MKDVIFHYGLHKTATTWFQEIYFSTHPEIELLNDFIAPWQDDVIRYIVKTSTLDFEAEKLNNMLSKRINCEKVNIISAERLSGHPYSGAYDRENIAEKITTAYPDSKAIIFYRNQVDLIKSIYIQMVIEGYCHSFKTMLEGACWKGPCFNMGIYKYDQMAKIYLKYYRRNNIKFFSFDDFINNKSEVIKNLNDFIGVSNTTLINDKLNKTVNTSLSGIAVNMARVLNHLIESEYNKPFLNFRLKRLKKALKQLNIGSNNNLNKYNDYIKNYYLESNNNFIEMLNNYKIK